MNTVTKTKRAAELARLANLADAGLLCVGSDNPDVARILSAIDSNVQAVPLDPSSPTPYSARLRTACDLFASAAMSEAVRLGYVE